jgi:hypothetical protein
MKRTVQVYIEGERIELFDDEKINVSSTIQNVQDISKVFTDFSQSFTVPASPVNNQIFQHFYANEVDGTLNHNIRRDAFLEIDHTFFRRGKIQLEKSDIKDSDTESYAITFYGDVRTLKDRFGEDKLAMLDYSAYTHPYSGADILERVSSIVNDFDVRYPLISSKRVWQYNEPSTPLDNIDTFTGRIFYTELFPALRISKIFEVFEATYGVTFLGNFLNDQRFTNLFLYLKNSETFTFLSSPTRVNITSELNGSYWDNVFYPSTDTVLYTAQQTDYYNGKNELYFKVTSASTSATYYIDVYINGALTSSVSGTGVAEYNVATIFNAAGLNQEMYFQVKSTSAVTLGIELRNEFWYTYEDPTGTGQTIYAIDYQIADCDDVILTGDVNLSTNMPDMKVADFFSGILKQFNLTCYPADANTFYIEPLEDWYAKGGIYDISKYVITDTIEVKRVPLYKKIEFSYDKSESFMNNTFKSFFNRPYADLSANFTYDGGDLQIKAPFEEPLFNKFTGTQIQVGYNLKDSPSFTPYVPKPTVLYFNGMENIIANDFKFDDGAIMYNVENYGLFGQDLDYNGIKYSLCWGQEVSSFYQVTSNNSLYQTYYSAYLNNLYDVKNRLTTVKTLLPLRILTELKLNDRLIIRDKRYIINEMKSDLTSGEVTFTLLNDFRSLRRKKEIKPNPTKPKVYVPIGMVNKSVQADIDITGTGVISAIPSSFTEDTIVEIELPAYTTDVYNVVSEEEDIIISEDGTFTLINEEGEYKVFDIPLTFTFGNGDTETEILTIIQGND